MRGTRRAEDLALSARTRVPVSPDVLSWARATSGASVEEAASRISQEPSVLESWEAGAQHPTLGALTELADFYDQPLAVFLLDEPPEAPQRPPDLRAAATHGGRPLGRVSVLAINQARRIQALVATIRGEGNWLLPDVRGLDPEAAAAQVRARLDTSVEEQSSWMNPASAFSAWRRYVERTGVVVLQADLPLDEVRAFSLPDPPPVVVINEHDYGASKSFSLFHELGHIALRSGGICSPLGSASGSRLSNAERWSDRFAGALLVPADQLGSDGIVLHYGARVGQITKTDLSKVASRFNVSTAVTWYRMRETGLVSDDTFRTRWTELDHKPAKPRRDRQTAPRIARWQRAAWRVGRGLAAEIIGAEERGDLSVTETMRGLNVHLEDLDKLSSTLR